MSQNIIFLDIDGVLNNHAQSLMHKKESTDWIDKNLPTTLQNMLAMIDLSNARNLRIISENVPNLAFIISSAWAMHFSLEEIKQMLKFLNISTPVLGITPRKMSSQRCEEIYMWFEHNALSAPFTPDWVSPDLKGKIEVKEFLTLDDKLVFPLGDFYRPLHERFFKTDQRNGLTYTDALEIIKHFNPQFKVPGIML